MRISRCVAMAMYVMTSTASAAPSEEDLLPIDIPVSSPAKTKLALALKDACDAIASHDDKLGAAQSNGTKFDPAAFAGWSGEKPTVDALRHQVDEAQATVTKAAKATDPTVLAAKRALQESQNRLDNLLQAAKSSASGLRDACTAIGGQRPFTDLDIASIRAFAMAPEQNDKAVKAFLVEGTATSQSSIPALPELTSGSLETYLIGGLADFVYKRAKAEAFDYLAQQLKDLLCTDARKPFFKNVCIAFDDLDSSVSLGAIGSYLVAAARKDMERLPDITLVYALSALTVTQDDRVSCAKEAAACEALTDARLALAFYEEVSRGRRPLDIARAMHSIAFTVRQRAQAPRSTDAIELASQILDAIMRQEGWQYTLEAKTELPYFAISTLITLDDLRDSWDLDAAWLNSKGVSWLFKLGDFVKEAAQVHARIESVIENLQKPASDEEGGKTTTLSKSDLARAASGTLQLLLDLPIKDLGVEVPDGFLKVQKLMHLGEMISSGEAVGSIAVELQDLYVRLVGDASAKTASQALASVEVALPVMTQLARAQSADEVTKILEAAAAPVGSYKLKSKKSMVSLTAFAGVAGGFERIARSWGEPMGVFAPVGVHASWPVSTDGKHGSWGVMLSVVNLGNLVSERLDSDLSSMEGTTTTSVSADQSESLRSVFSPGAFVTKSIAGPFDLGLGAQVVPSARNVTKTTTDMLGATTSETDKRSAIQVLLFVGIDVTIFPF